MRFNIVATTLAKINIRTKFSTSGSVLVMDQDGNVISVLNPPATFNVFVASGIDEGDSTTTYTTVIALP